MTNNILSGPQAPKCIDKCPPVHPGVATDFPTSRPLGWFLFSPVGKK